MKLDLRVDFVRRTRAPTAGLAAMAVAILLLAWQGLEARDDYVALEQQRAGLAALARPGVKASPAMTPRDIERHAQMEQLARQLATPWPSLLHMFETRARTGVVLLSLRPSAAEQRLELVGRATSVQALGAYLESLDEEPMLRDVLMTRHEVVTDDPARPVEFSMTANWQPAVADAASGKVAAR
jgi:Tfp pilus assembly protein PilN